VAKRLSGSECRLGWWAGSVEGGCIRWDGDRRRGIIVTSGDGYAVFPNYFGEDLFLDRQVARFVDRCV